MRKYRFDHPKKNLHGWYVGVKGDIYRYLHDDLQVKDSTDGDGKSSGYFPTKHEAYIAIYKFDRKQMEQAKNDRIDSTLRGSRDVRDGDDTRDLDGSGAMTKQIKIGDGQSKDARQAAGLIGQCMAWDHTPEGSKYWGEVRDKLQAIGKHGTTDGKPYVQPVPPVPDGYRLAVDSDAGRKDMMLFDEKSGKWELRPWPAMPMFLGHGYIVPADIAPTDEEASRLPLVMVRDYEDRPWERKVLVRVASTGLFYCLGLSRRNLESWSRCRHLYPGE